MFVFENVLGILTAKKGEPFRDLQRLVRELDYDIDFKEQIASDYGVLQKRHRMIIVGWKKNTSYHYPLLQKQECKYKVLKDLFSDLPERKAGEGELCKPVQYTKPLSEMPYLKESGIRGVLNFTTQHIARPNNLNDREIYVWAIKKWYKEQKQLRYTDIPADHQRHKNKETFLNRFTVVNPDGVSHTVVAHIAMDGHYYIYPVPNPTTDNVRSITIREAARLQSFPDDYYFEGSRSAAFKQIGNAVPVVLAYKIAAEIKKMLDNE
jgi:DNA (cytosine-5)-methyltransferase 1